MEKKNLLISPFSSMREGSKGSGAMEGGVECVVLCFSGDGSGWTGG